MSEAVLRLAVSYSMNRQQYLVLFWNGIDICRFHSQIQLYYIILDAFLR